MAIAIFGKSPRSGTRGVRNSSSTAGTMRRGLMNVVPMYAGATKK